MAITEKRETKFKNTEIGLIPEEWEVETLETICNFKTGKLNSNASVINGVYPFFTCSPQTFKTNTFSFDQEAILLAGNNANGNFSIKFFNGKFDAYQRTYVINSINQSQVNNKYLYYALSIMLESLKNFSTGSATRFLTLSILNSLPIAVPSIDEQKSIAEILSSLDEKIELNCRMNKTLEEMGKALFKRWFVDFEFPNEDGKPYKSSGGKMVDSELGEIPEGWKVNKLGKHISFIKGKKPPQVFQSIETGLIKQILIETLDGGTSLFAKPEKMIIANKSDLIMVMDGASSGRVETGFEGALGSTLAIIKVTELLNKYVYQFFKSRENEIKLNTTGAAIPHADKSKIIDFDIVIPTKQVLSKFNEICLDFDHHIQIIKIENSNLIDIRNLLLPKLISGRIRVEGELCKA